MLLPPGVPHEVRPVVLPIRSDDRRTLAIRFDEAGRWTHLVGRRRGRDGDGAVQ